MTGDCQVMCLFALKRKRWVVFLLGVFTLFYGCFCMDSWMLLILMDFNSVLFFPLSCRRDLFISLWFFL